MTYQELPELLTMKQACQLLSVHPNTLRNWEREGRISAVRLGSRRDRRFPKVGIWQMTNPFQNTIATNVI
jgi:excisionase family DNA binding protein